jgi:rhodanese-related sulfurtransferase
MSTVITAEELHALHTQGQPITLIDVRTPAEFSDTHVPFAKNIPLDQLDPAAIKAQHPDASQTLYVICQSGMRANQARQKLVAEGLPNVLNVVGGTNAWVQASFPVTHGKKAISLERQVRIAAGSLVVLGVILALTVHPWLIGLSAFVGAGLVFAGITDTCGMGLLLAKMPWNNRPTKPSGPPAACNFRPPAPNP